MTREMLISILGWPGRMISGSKSSYMERNPTHNVVFNANVCTDSEGKIWYGDLDLTLDSEKLTKLATELNCRVYVLREMDGRFDAEASPKLEKAVAVFEPSLQKVIDA